MKRTKLYGVCSERDGPRVYMAAWGKRDCDPIAARLTGTRKGSDLTIPQMAKLLGVARSSVWRWEHGVIESMSLAMVQRWAHFTCVPWQWIVEGGELPDRVRYSLFVMNASVALTDRLKPLPDELGVVSTWEQRRDQVIRDRLRELEEEEDRKADAAALRQSSL